MRPAQGTLTALERTTDPTITTPGSLRTSLRPTLVVPIRADQEGHQGIHIPVAEVMEGLPTGQEIRTGTRTVVIHRLAPVDQAGYRVDHQVEADPVSPILGATVLLLCLHENNLTARSKKARRLC